MNTILFSNDAKTVADALNLGTLADGDAGVSPAVLRDLYRHVRGVLGQRVAFHDDPTFVRGWVNLAAPDAAKLVAAFVATDDADDMRIARRMAQANLEAQPWNDLLGIDEPAIVCKVKLHGKRWGIRFQSAACLKGQELVNEQLPPIPDDSGTIDPQPDEGAQPPPPSDESCALANADAEAAARAVLRAGGLPA